MATNLTTKDVAAELGTTPRTLRKFLRADAKANGGEVGVDTPGKGKRYVFETKELAKIRSNFAEWEAARSAPDEDEVDETE